MQWPPKYANMSTSRIVNMMEMAWDLALQSNEDCRHGCVIAKRSKVLGVGWNKGKTHPVAAATHTQCIHAEMAAIIGVNKEDLIGADLFVIRVKRSSGEPLGMSRPCKHCAKLIQAAQIKRVYFSTENGQVEMIKF